MGPKNRKRSAKTSNPTTATATATTTANTTASASASASASAGANASNRAKKPKDDQYHHIIPRFILRKFIIEGHKNPGNTRKNRTTTPQLFDPINCYDVPSGAFSLSSADTSYGVADLYINAKNANNVYEIERKLSTLESSAAQSIALLHKTVESRPPGGLPSGELQYFRIKRKFLNNLRKFMFIMYFRNDKCKAHHFNDEHPDNSGAAAWIRAYRRKNNLEASEVWLHVLKYYLDTPHTDLVVQGEKAQDQLGPGGIANFPRGIDPDIEGVEILQYSGEANNFFLAVWEAADGEEFIISNNSFGLCESVTGPGGKTCPFHRFYVISPRIAIVLCSLPWRPDAPTTPEIESMFRMSRFWGAPHRSPRVTKDGQLVGRSGRVETYEEDIMEYEIVKLSKEFTHLVNAVILGNARVDTGAITFRTPAAMLKTLEAFSRNMDYNNQALYLPLVEELLKMTGRSSSTFKVIPNPNPESGTLLFSQPDAPGDPPGFWEMNLELVDRIEAKKNDGGPGAFMMPLIMKTLLEKAALKIGRTPHDINPKPARLRRSISDRDCAHVFALVEKFIRNFLGLGMPPVFPELMMVEFLRWLLAERRLMFEILETRFPVGMMEWVYDEPDREKVEENYRSKRANIFGGK